MSSCAASWARGIRPERQEGHLALSLPCLSLIRVFLGPFRPSKAGRGRVRETGRLDLKGEHSIEKKSTLSRALKPETHPRATRPGASASREQDCGCCNAPICCTHTPHSVSINKRGTAMTAGTTAFAHLCFIFASFKFGQGTGCGPAHH